MILTILLSLLLLTILFLCVIVATIRYKESQYAFPISLFAVILNAFALNEHLQKFVPEVIALYPAALACLIHGIIKPLSKRDIYIFTLIQIGMLFSIFPPYPIQTAILILLYVYTTAAIHKSVSFRYGIRIFQIVTSISSIILLYLLCKQDDTLRVILIVVSIILFLSIAVYDILKRSQVALSKLRTLARINADLTKFNRLLKQRNDQYVAILNKKDNDIQILSKYSTMAELTASIAHEIAQPLTGIKSLAQNMMDDINLDDFNHLEALSELQKICTMVDKATYIIDHIRSFNTNNHTYKLIDINSIIMNAVTLTHNQLKKHNIDTILLLNDTIPKIYGNSISIEQILLNLITNARDAIVEKAKKAGSDYSGKIILKTDASDDYVIITVEDNGIGIQPDIQKHIWSPFFTTKKFSQSLGIGLSISKKIINDHNGEIEIDSTPDHGTTFTIRFSLQK